MGDLEREKRNRSASLRGNLAAVEDVTEWLPDIVFEAFLTIDLGDRFVELWHFGRGNGPGTSSSTSQRLKRPGPATS
jgi:cyclase